MFNMNCIYEKAKQKPKHTNMRHSLFYFFIIIIIIIEVLVQNEMETEKQKSNEQEEGNWLKAYKK